MQLAIVFFFLIFFSSTFIILLTKKKEKEPRKEMDVNLERDRAEIESYLRELRSIQFAAIEDSKKKLK